MGFKASKKLAADRDSGLGSGAGERRKEEGGYGRNLLEYRSLFLAR